MCDQDTDEPIIEINDVLEDEMRNLTAPTAIVDLAIEDHAVKTEVSAGVILNQTPEIPDAAYDQLEQLAHAEGNNQLIIVDNQVRICNIKPSPTPHKDYTIAQAFAVAGEDLKAAAPRAIDLRDTFSAWKIKDQGSTGACAGFSASSLMEYCFTKTKRLNPGETLSPGFLWMSAKENDEFTDEPTSFIEQEGTSLTGVLKIIQRFGCVRESVMPFGTLYSKTAQDLYSQAAALRCGSYYNVGKNQDNWKSWLSKYGPLYVAINVDSSWMNASKDTGILKAYNAKEQYGGHAVVICGYDSDKDYFIFKNSWGTSWADGGYAYASSKWCAQAVLEAYGVAV